MARHIVFHIEVQFGLRRGRFGVIDIVAVFRLSGFLQRQIAFSRDDFYLLISVRLRCGDPDSDFLPSRKISYRKGIVKREMAGILADGGQSEGDEQRRQYARSEER